MSSDQKIVTRLSLLMRKQRVTQWELAQAVGLQQPQISLICSGINKEPDSAVLELIAAHLQFEQDPKDLLEDMGSMVK